DMFGPKMRKMVEEVEGILNKEQGISNNEGNGIQQEQAGYPTNSQSPTTNSIYLYCWRGGMRSAAVAWLLDLYGFKVHTLAGGYKAFRNHVLQTFQQPFPLNTICG